MRLVLECLMTIFACAMVDKEQELTVKLWAYIWRL